MNRVTKFLAPALLAALAGIIAPAALALGEFAAYDEIVAARIAREKARITPSVGQSGEGFPEASLAQQRGRAVEQAGCGNISIANIVNAQRFNGLRNLTVIVEGPVISTDNNCR